MKLNPFLDLPIVRLDSRNGTVWGESWPFTVQKAWLLNKRLDDWMIFHGWHFFWGPESMDGCVFIFVDFWGRFIPDKHAQWPAWQEHVWHGEPRNNVEKHLEAHQDLKPVGHNTFNKRKDHSIVESSSKTPVGSQWLSGPRQTHPIRFEVLAAV